MTTWLFDSDVLIDYLRGYEPATKFVEDSLTHSLCHISTITVAELYAGVRDGSEQKILKNFMQMFEIIIIDSIVAQQGGLYRRDYGKSHNVGLADAIIAASAQSINATLVTLNIKHYPMFATIHVPYKKNHEKN